jgi:hypothetical protein
MRLDAWLPRRSNPGWWRVLHNTGLICVHLRASVVKFLLFSDARQTNYGSIVLRAKVGIQPRI